jgi:hypothetical protein
VETHIRTPEAVFSVQQRLVVPLFQRPYVWNEDAQWQPLWEDLLRVTEPMVTPETAVQSAPHFIGAIVVQRSPFSFGALPEHTIIDGQQRLTTLQLLFDAIRLEVEPFETRAAERLRGLVENSESYRQHPEDRFKVWPTNRDRPAFEHVMVGQSGDAPREGARLAHAHQFFRERVADWVAADGLDDAPRRALALETAARTLFSVVVIDLTADEDAQEIFETLNARGAPLTAADLVKNLVFRRLLEDGADVEQIYHDRWAKFETGFWEAEVSVGRTKLARSSLFLNHWLVSRLGEEVRTRDVFYRFKRLTVEDSTPPMEHLVGVIDRAASIYEEFTKHATTSRDDLSRLELFAYRLTVMEIDAFRPVVLALLDPELEHIPGEQLEKALGVLESVLVRRMLVHATSASYSQIAAELCRFVRGSRRQQAGDLLEEFFTGQTALASYWPGDAEVGDRLRDERLYGRLNQRRLRMVLEAIEDDLRGWRIGRIGLGGQRVPRGQFTIEHVLPQRWEANWPPPQPPLTLDDRNQLLHRLGNLTLVTDRLNPTMSNAAWLGEDGKRAALQAHDVLMLNRQLVEKHSTEWTDRSITDRGAELAAHAMRIWPVPEGHAPANLGTPPPTPPSASVADLVAAGLLNPGALLYARPHRHRGRTAVVLPDGRIEVDGEAYASPSGAAGAIAGRHVNGWRFFCIDEGLTEQLRIVRRRYADEFALDDGDDENDDPDNAIVAPDEE